MQSGTAEKGGDQAVDMNLPVKEQEKEIVEEIVKNNFTGEHLMECLSSLFKDAKSIPDLNFDDALLKNIELLVSLINCLTRAEHWDQVASAFTLYFNNFTEGSVTSTLLDYVMELFEFTPQSRESGVSDLPAFIRLMRLSRDNFTLLKGNPLFSHFSKFLGLVVAVGMCEPASVTFELGTYKLFEPCMKTAHGTSENILEAIFHSVTFFVERIYFCLKNKSIKPLLISDDEAVDMDEEMANLTIFWNLHRNGNLYEVKGVHEHEFERRLNTLGFKLKNLLSCKTGIEKQIIRDKYVKVLGMIGDLIILNTNGDLREAPFHVQLYGDSGVGKSTAMAQLRNVLLASADLPLDPQYEAAINPNDPYMSNWTSDKLVMVLDDFANTRADKVREPPTGFIIMAKNNAPAYAPKAEIEGKGKCAIKPKLMFTTTNCKDLAAAKYSVNPFSIQNRSDIVLVLKNRKECMRAFHGAYSLDQDKCNTWHASNGRDNSMVEDVWIVDMQKPVRPKDETHVAEYRNIYNDEGKEMCDLPMVEVAQELVKLYAKHRDTQKQILERNKLQRKLDYTLCGVDGCKCPKALCQKHVEMKVQSGVLGTKLDSTIDRLADKATAAVTRQCSWLAFRTEDVATISLIAAARIFSTKFDWMILIPRPWLENERFLQLTMLYNREKIFKKYVWLSICNWLVPILMLFCCIRINFIALSFPWFVFAGVRQMGLTNEAQLYYREEIFQRNDAISSTVKEYRDQVTAQAGKAVLGLGILYVLSKFCARMARYSYKPQGSLLPKDVEDIKERDKEENVWATQTIRKLPMGDVAKSSTPDELENKIRKNLFYAEISAKGRTLVANVLYLRTNLVVIPVHYFIDEHLDVVFHKARASQGGGKHRYKISKYASARIGNTDLALCYCASGGSMCDLTKYFPTGDLSSHQFHLVYRKVDGEIIRAHGLANYKVTSNGFASFPGGEYDKFDMNTFEGLCGAVLISHGSGSAISGFHLGGKTGTPKGCYGTLFETDVEQSIKLLSAIPGVLFSGNSGEGFKPHLLGKQILTDQPVPDKSPANYLPQDSSLQYHGRCIGAKTTYSSVRKTPISEVVTQVCGSENCYNGPKLKPEWWGPQKCLSGMSKPGIAYPFPLLEYAVRDYVEPLVEVLKESEYWQETRPLTDQENFNGVDGKRFIDKLVTKTSMGVLGLTPTAKKNYIVETEDEDGKIQMDFTPEVREMIDSAEKEYAMENRAWTIAVANKKDEVLSKEKCRMFFANPITLTWLIRKYFLPIARFIQMNPLLSECAVGINAHGPEWQEFQKYILQFGVDALINGDFKEFDIRTVAQMLLAAFDVMNMYSMHMNYTEEDRTIMRALASDVVYSLVAFDGDLYGIVEGTHISGNSLTVLLNSIVNSLHMRCVFYTVYQVVNYESRVPFRKACALGCYGDDNAGTVGEKYRKFNMVTLSRTLAEYGVTYTNPDKSTHEIEFWPYEEFEFLKRSNRYNEEIGLHLGALAEKSIFKSLHCYMRGKSPALTEELACATNLDGALREWFAHGRDVYEQRRKEMALIALTEVNGVPLSSLCRELSVTYDDRVEAWIAKYPSD